LRNRIFRESSPNSLSSSVQLISIAPVGKWAKSFQGYRQVLDRSSVTDIFSTNNAFALRAVRLHFTWTFPIRLQFEPLHSSLGSIGQKDRFRHAAQIDCVVW